MSMWLLSVDDLGPLPPRDNSSCGSLTTEHSMQSTFTYNHFQLKKKSLFYFKKNKQALLIILQWPFEIPKAPSLIPSSECLVYPCSLSISEHFPHEGSLTFSYMQVSHTYVYIKFSYFLWLKKKRPPTPLSFK